MFSFNRFFIASTVSLSLLSFTVPISLADDEIHEPPSFGSVVETQTTTQTTSAPTKAAYSAKSAPLTTSSAPSVESKTLTTSISFGQTKCSLTTTPVVVGIVGASNKQRAEVFCVPRDGYESTPHYLAHYALDKLGEGFSQRGIDHIQVMMIKKVYITPDSITHLSRTEKQSLGLHGSNKELVKEARKDEEKRHKEEEKLKDEQIEHDAQANASEIPTLTQTKAIYRSEIYRFSTDWPRFLGHAAERQNNKLLAATNDGNLQALYVTVDGVSDSAIFGIFNQALTSLGPNAGTLGLAAVGLVQAGK